MNPADLYSATLASLVSARSAMLTPEWQDALENVSKVDRVKASHKLLDTQHAILVLANTQLSTIAQKMADQKDALGATIDNLAKALASLQKVGTVLDAITSILNVLARIIPLI